MKTLNFYDLSTRTKFRSSKYTKHSKRVNGRTMYFAKTISPSGTKTTRILSKVDFNSK